MADYVLSNKAGGIFVVRVLHRGMDVSRHLDAEIGPD
jgi:plasmid stabilization system protein ParE